jgi:hypothetical protein
MTVGDDGWNQKQKAKQQYYFFNTILKVVPLFTSDL